MDIRQLILPAGIGLSHIKVYTEPGPDGVPGGSPHLHLVSSEMYFVLAGSGEMELLSHEGPKRLELSVNNVVLFRPGIIHRILNPKRNLEILAIMQNGGLPEQGDFVMSFPEEIMADEAKYRTSVQASDHASAVARRDLAVEGFNRLKATWATDAKAGQAALHMFYHHAREMLVGKVAAFEWVWKSGPVAEAQASMDAIDFLRMGRLEYLSQSRWAELDPLDQPAKAGTCGEVHPYALNATFLAEGKKPA